MKYRCKVCGQVFEVKDGEEPVCPVCKAKGEQVVPYVEEEMTWAAEHVIGVAKGVDSEVLEGLRTHLLSLSNPRKRNFSNSVQ